MLRRPVILTAAVALATALAGCSSAPQAATAAPVAATATEPSAPLAGRDEGLTRPLEPSLTQVTAAATAAPTTAAATAAAKAAAPTFDVAAVQRTLIDLRYYVGPVDGKAGPALRSAVMAFQKVQGLGVDGGVGAATLAALAAPTAPVLKGVGPANRVEVDLTRQVLYVVKGGAVQRIMPVSSGNGATYAQKDGSTARALTPTGFYTIQRRIVGERVADLGTLYDPQYFYKGWAIHGSNSVPAGPASHGCIRVTRSDAKWLLNEINNGMSVHLYGGTHVFSAGSSAPGTDNPTGDNPGAAPAPAQSTPPQSTPTQAPPSSAPPTQAPRPSAPPSQSPPSQPPPTQEPSSPPNGDDAPAQEPAPAG